MKQARFLNSAEKELFEAAYYLCLVMLPSVSLPQCLNTKIGR